MRTVKGNNCKLEHLGNGVDSHPRLPVGFGTIRYLGPGRRFPYAVHPPKDRETDQRRAPAICYVKDWFTGLAVLASWHAGFYQEGMEREIDWKLMTGNRKQSKQFLPSAGLVRNVYQAYYEWKFGQNAARRLSSATEQSCRMTSGKLSPIWDRHLDDLTIEDLQAVVNRAGKNVTIVSKTMQLIKGLYRFALPRGICSRDPAAYLIMPDTQPNEHYEPFTDEELAVLWKHQQDPVVRMILIMCYSGFRIGAWADMETHREEGFFCGGLKTAAGKHRIVPIHSAIQPLVREVLSEGKGYYCGYSVSWFRRMINKKLTEIGIENENRHHTPHSCRHTFSRLCESYGVREADRKRMLGHSFKGDITNGVYGHRTVEELRTEIEKIHV